MLEQPETRVLTLIRWQLFATLTFKRADIGDRVRYSTFMAWLREVSNVSRVSLNRLLWCCRKEAGESFGRLHFHCLIGGLPAEGVHIGKCFQSMRLWNRVGGGFSQVRVFDPNFDGLDYLFKGLGGADCYESAKFASGRPVLTLSESCRRVVRRGSLRTNGPLNNVENSGASVGLSALCQPELVSVGA
jgi:hypothetical protein